MPSTTRKPPPTHPPRSLQNLPLEIAIHLEQLSFRNSFGITPKGPWGPWGGVGWGVRGGVGIGGWVGGGGGGVGKLPCRGYKRASPDKLLDRRCTERIFWVGGMRVAYMDLYIKLTFARPSPYINPVYSPLHFLRRRSGRILHRETPDIRLYKAHMCAYGAHLGPRAPSAPKGPRGPWGYSGAIPNGKQFRVESFRME